MLNLTFKILKYLDIKKIEKYYNIKYRKEVDSIMKIERIQQERIWLKNGQLGLLSTARLPDGRYETMLLDQNGEEIVSAITNEEEVALATFRFSS